MFRYLILQKSIISVEINVPDHTLNLQYISEFQQVVSNIQTELSVVEFDMIFLMCDDLKSALVRITREHIFKLLNVLISKHRNECNRVCEEFEKIKHRALKRPDTTEELNEMAKFIDIAKTTGIVQLREQIEELKKSMSFLLDIHLFPHEDIELNTRVLLWPSEIGPIFDKNEEVCQIFIIKENLCFNTFFLLSLPLTYEGLMKDC